MKPRSLTLPALAALTALLGLAHLPAQAIGRLADVTIVDRDTGATLPVHYARGEYWVAGRPGARYAITVLQGLDAAPTRQNVLAACQRRNPLDLGGFQVRFDGNKRSGHYVTQSMLSPDGRVVG